MADGAARVLGARRAGDARPWRALRPTTAIWVLPFAAGILFLYIWRHLGLYDGEALPFGEAVGALCLGGLLTLPRNRLAELLSRLLLGVGARGGHGAASDATHGEGQASPAGAADARSSRALRIVAVVLHALWAAGVLALCAWLGHLAIELPWNDELADLDPAFVRLECATIALALVALYFAFQRHGAGPAVGLAALYVIGLAQYFVVEFRGVALLPSDLSALGTAAEVSSGYVYSIGSGAANGLVPVALGLLACAYLQPLPLRTPRRPDGEAAPEAEALGDEARDAAAPQPATEGAGAPHALGGAHTRGARRARTAAGPDTRRGPRRRVLVNVGCAAASVAALVAFVTVPTWRSDFGVNMSYWNTPVTYKQHAFIPTFVVAAQELPIEAPDGYSEQAAVELEGSYAKTYDEDATPGRAQAVAQFDETQPSVVVIMNESFSDLSIYQSVRDAGYEGPSFITTGLTDALARGELQVSVLGGGTCNTEFEFLTGTSLAFAGHGNPYTLYNFYDVNSLPRQFKELGYDTTAIHPNTASNWRRNIVYPQLGFDRFLDWYDFPEDAPTLHAGIRDSATYDKVLEVLASSDRPQFVFDVTMQNHSGYEMNNIPDELLTHYEAQGTDDAQLNEYLSCVTASDADLEQFIGELRGLDRPVIVVFFGDHQPGFTADLNDATETDDNHYDHIEREFKTTYLIWANYDVAGTEQTSATHDTSASTLAAHLMELVGGPLTDHQKQELVCERGLPLYNLYGYCDTQGSWHAIDDASTPEARLLADLRTTSYLEFGSKV